MANLKLSLDKRRSKKDKTYPLVFRITVNGDSRTIPIGNSILENEWNPKTETIKKSIPTYDLITEKVKTLQLKYLTKIMEYERNHPWQLNAQEIRDYILADHKTTATVYDFWQQEIDLMQKANRNGGARIYMETLSALQKIRNFKIKFEQIDYTFLKEVEAELINNGVSKALIGTKFPGDIEKKECEAYQYKVPGTEESITLKHSYQYVDNNNVEEAVFQGAIA